ncbi:DNA damage-inducible protein 1 [Fusarium keratoplasticum]|nr:DNA damage-inducible protein 1 [Fusarium keratoplasticum]
MLAPWDLGFVHEHRLASVGFQDRIRGCNNPLQQHRLSDLSPKATMRITLNIFNPQAGEQDSLLTLEIFPDMTLATLRESIQAESTIPPTSQHLYHNGRLISDDAQTMEQHQIKDGDMLALHVRDMRGSTGVPEQARRPQPRRRGGNEQDPELIRLQILGQPAVRAQLQRQHPELAAAVDNPARFAQIFHDSQDREQRERMERQREIERLNDDPFNVENQRKIEEMIRQERVMENLQNAMEHNPEVFGRVHMLYLDVAPAPVAAPAAPPAAPPAAVPAQPAAPRIQISPQAIESLVSMGATREQAIQALQAADGNADVAASLIFF